MKSHRHSPLGRPARPLALAAGVALLSCVGLASAANPRVERLPQGEIATLDAPAAQQRLSAQAARPHPFATARQRAAAQPLVWTERSPDRRNEAADAAELAQSLARSAGSAPGGDAPAFANYLARNHFRGAWERLEAQDARQAAAGGAQTGAKASDGLYQPMDGAHYGYSRFPGNYYTSQWKASPWNKIGKLYFTKPNGSGSYCTANVISPNNVLVTAAHCVYTFGSGWNSNFVFVPAERYGQTPYGSFGWTQARVPNNWISQGTRRWDVAVIKLAGEQTSGLPVTSYVGWLGRSWNQPYSLYTYSHGYASNLSTQYTHICAGQTYDSASEGTNVLVQGCDMTYGASGGAWLINYTPNSGSGNHVNSVVSGPHIGAFGTAWVGARFADENIVALCTAIGC